jgi:GT2 family glycosyltransferase/predicted O-methyltransferase YrrM
MTRRVFVLTPWYGDESLRFLDGYAAAMQHPRCAVIAWNNGLSEVAVHAITTKRIEVYGNGENLGFAGGNAAAYAAMNGLTIRRDGFTQIDGEYVNLLSEEQAQDIIVFANNDIQGDPTWVDQCLADVHHGALYGISLQAQLVLGRWLPYLEGWCIAATRSTWEQLGGVSAWAATRYSDPYWEDNDLCLRALAAGIDLIQTSWRLQHLGGGTSGSLAKWGEAMEKNRATYTALARDLLPPPVPMTPLRQRYFLATQRDSDIRHHLGFLYSIAQGRIVELGTRSGESTSAFLAGVEAHGGSVTSVDIVDCGALFDTPLWRFVQRSSVDPATVDAVIGNEEIDVLFVDTDHTYEQCAAELALWGGRVKKGGWIVGHDPETFPGVRRAFEEYAAATRQRLTVVTPNNGMAIIKVGEGQ